MFYRKIFFSNRRLIELLIVLMVAFIIGCSSAPEIKPSEQTQEPLINYALSLQGTPYRWGKETPEEGFDCSGFVRHVYGKYGIRLPRKASDMASVLPTIPMDDLLAGDLVFFNTNGSSYSHVGIFLHHDKFIHAPNRRVGKVLISSMNNRYWHNHFVGARRPQRH